MNLRLYRIGKRDCLTISRIKENIGFLNIRMDKKIKSGGIPMGNQMKKIKAIELVFDWNLWPRHKSEDLDSTNLRRIKSAILAGIKLPPVIVNKKDNRIVDGFHRTKAYLSLFGDDVEIDAEFKDYKNDAEMFMDSARLNNQHGLPLSPIDRAYVIDKARKFKIPIPIIAEILGMNGEEAKTFLEKRSAITKTGERVLLSGGCINLRGKVLTDKQLDYTRHAPGSSAQLYSRLLLEALNADAIIFNDKIINTLIELNKKIDKILLEVVA